MDVSPTAHEASATILATVQVSAVTCGMICTQSARQRRGRKGHLTDDGEVPANADWASEGSSLPPSFWAYRGVRTSGSGKTSLAILRSWYLSDPSASHGGRTLLVTFNRCLVTYMRYLAGVVQKPVDFRNYHHFTRGYLRFRNKLPWNSICDPSQRLRLIEAAIKARRDAGMRDATLDRPSRFFDEEFKWIQGHGIGKLQGYVDIERTGRSTGLRRAQRPI